MAKYTTVEEVTVDGKVVEAGQEVELTVDQAAELGDKVEPVKVVEE